MCSLDCELEGVWSSSSSLHSALVLALSSASSPPVTSRLLLAPPSSPAMPPPSVSSWLVPSRATGRRRVRRTGEEGEGRAHVVPYCNLHEGPCIRAQSKTLCQSCAKMMSHKWLIQVHIDYSQLVYYSEDLYKKTTMI